MDEQQQIEAYPYADELNDLASAVRLRTERVLELLRLKSGYLTSEEKAAVRNTLGELNELTDSLRHSYVSLVGQLD
jgi:hypothetical protein